MDSLPPGSETASVDPSNGSLLEPPDAPLTLDNIDRVIAARNALQYPHQFMFTALADGTLAVTTMSEASLNDLRLRVLDGEDIPAREMLIIVNDIRRDRRAAARVVTGSGRGSRRAKPETQSNFSTEDLKSILDQDLS